MQIVGLVGAGNMGCGLGWALRAGGHDVITSLEGRSPRTARLVEKAGVRTVPRLADVTGSADVILVVTPPGAAIAAASSIAALGGTALVADMNAIAPLTAYQVMGVLQGGGLDMVDGSISGPPPTMKPGANIYLSGPRVDEVASLSWRHVTPIVLSDQVGAASAVKMSTASVYKGLMALTAQAMRAAHKHGVLEHVMRDLGSSPYQVAMAASKAERYVPEMLQIASSQASPALFSAFAEIWDEISRTDLAQADPESVDPEITAQEVVERLS